MEGERQRETNKQSEGGGEGDGGRAQPFMDMDWTSMSVV